MADLPQALFNYWRSSYEENSDLLAVYRPPGFDFPPARWRDGFEIASSGRFALDTPDAGDGGVVKIEGTWVADDANRLRGVAGANRRILNIESVAPTELGIWREDLIAGEFLFTVTYTNYAFGFRNNGFVVDNTAGLDLFDRSAEGPADDPPGGVYSHADLTARFAPGRRFLRSVPVPELVEMHRLIESASQGKQSDPVNTANDAGTWEYAAYRFDSDTATYHQVVLATDGDWTSANQSEEAQRLTAWLKQLGADVD